MPEPLTGEQLDNLMAELMFAEDLHRGNTGTPGKYGVAVIAIADLRERVAELEAVIEKAVRHLDVVFGGSVHILVTRRILESAPSAVLEERDREIAARALEDAAASIPERMRMDELGLHGLDFTQRSGLVPKQRQETPDAS